MQTSFYRKLSTPTGLAVLDTAEYYGEGRIITRVNVPEAHRGKRIGRTLLADVCAAADDEGVCLFLEINASGGLNRDQLKDWYERSGFVEIQTGFWRRRPQGGLNEVL